MTTNIDITNRALATVGTRSKITSMTDGSTEALYANLLYNGLRDFLLREGDHDFAMQDIIPENGPEPSGPWLYSYIYPPSLIRIRQLIASTARPLDPKPVEWNIVTFPSNLRYIVTRVPVQVMIFTWAPPERLLGCHLHRVLRPTTRFFAGFRA